MKDHLFKCEEDLEAVILHENKDAFAARARLILRNREGGLLNRVSAGGTYSLRGRSPARGPSVLSDGLGGTSI